MQMNALERLIMLTVLVMVSAGLSYAQASRQFTVTIPFNFHVSGKALPAGQYTLGRSTETSAVGVVVRETAGRAGAFALTREIQNVEPKRHSQLVFRRYGDQYYLAEVWSSGRSTGRELSKSRNERILARELAKHGAIPEKVALFAEEH